MINNTVLVGRLTKDPELKATSSGKNYTQFTLAVNRNFKNADGENEADFISVVAWDKTAEFLCQYQRQGNQIGVVGRIQTRNYENDSGVRIYITEVVAQNIQFLDSKPKEDNGYTNQVKQEPRQTTQQEQVDSQDLPF